MILEEISSKEFDRYAKKHPLNSFYQSSFWGILKEKNGWKKMFLALKEGDCIKGATLLLEKNTFLGNIFYAPRGFLIDYEDFSLVQTMTLEVKKYIKKRKAILLKIDPYYEYLERDIDGNVVEGGFHHQTQIDFLKSLGFQAIYEEHGLGGLQPNWLFVLSLEGKTEESLLKEMSSQTKRAIHKTEKIGFELVSLEKKELIHFKKILEHTAERRGFLDRSLAYYQDMYNALGDHVKFLVARLHMKEYQSRLEKELKENEKSLKDVLTKLKDHPTSTKFEHDRSLYEQAIESLQKRIVEAKEIAKKHGEVVDMAGAMFLVYGDETLYLFGGAYEEFMHFNAQYALQWEMITYALRNGYKRHNFYGIENKFSKDDPMYGVYYFKRGFRGRVVELIGEYDLPVRKIRYMLYKLGLKAYRLTKR